MSGGPATGRPKVGAGGLCGRCRPDWTTRPMAVSTPDLPVPPLGPLKVPPLPPLKTPPLALFSAPFPSPGLTLSLPPVPPHPPEGSTSPLWPFLSLFLLPFLLLATPSQPAPRLFPLLGDTRPLPWCLSYSASLVWQASLCNSSQGASLSLVGPCFLRLLFFSLLLWDPAIKAPAVGA